MGKQKPKPLTAAERKTIVTAAHDELVSQYGGDGRTRSWLYEQRRVLRGGNKAPPAQPKPLTEFERKAIVGTTYEDLLRDFSGHGRTRSWLSEQRRILRGSVNTVDGALAARKARAEASDKSRLVEELAARNEQQAEQIRIMRELAKAKPLRPIEAKRGPKTQTEMVPIAMLSDLHVGETVIAAKVGGINEYNERIASERFAAWSRNVVRMVELYRGIRDIRTLVLPILGDLMTGNIHEENSVDTWCPPMAEAQFAQGLIVGAIESILEWGDLERIVIPCAVGNHARITRKPYHQSEVENSIETLIYAAIAQRFAADKRVDVIMPGSYLSHLDVLGLSVAYHHGHAIKYQGGIGGLAVPLLRYVHRQSSTRRADLYLCGHFHQSIDLGRVVVNGSMIGYNAYAHRAGFEAEKPQQSMVLVDARHGRGPVLPIWVTP